MYAARTPYTHTLSEPGSHRCDNRDREWSIDIHTTDFLIEASPEPRCYDACGYRADILDIALFNNVPFQIR
jgi:hypothetical protein